MVIGRPMEQKMRMELRQGMQLKQLLELRERLEQRVGDFERQILEKVELIDIDLDKSPYHIDMLQSLLVRESEEHDSLLGSIIKKKELTKMPIQKIIVESFNMEDIGLDLGTKRNVDAVTLVFEDDKQFSMTVSLDKDAVSEEGDSASYKEAAIPQQTDATASWSVQEYYGSQVLRDESGVRTLICKEFLDGQMLGNLTSEIFPAMTEEEKARMSRIAYAVGKMIANALTTLSGIPRDSNGLNIIIKESAGDVFTARYCDVEEIQKTPQALSKELKLLYRDFGEFGDEMLRGIREHYTGELPDTL